MASLLEEGTVEIGAKYSYGRAITVVNKTPLLDGGRVAGGIAIFQDVTELEQVAEELGSEMCIRDRGYLLKGSIF